MENLLPSCVSGGLQVFVEYIRCHDKIYNQLPEPHQFIFGGKDTLLQMLVLRLDQQVPCQVNTILLRYTSVFVLVCQSRFLLSPLRVGTARVISVVDKSGKQDAKVCQWVTGDTVLQEQTKIR